MHDGTFHPVIQWQVEMAETDLHPNTPVTIIVFATTMFMALERAKEIGTPKLYTLPTKV